MCKIAILLTCYNGADFIGEQIESIIHQTAKNWTLYIRDDCSTDNTPAIVRHYSVLHENIIQVPDILKRGAAQGFLWLLSQVEADYYMFSDQDDYWLPDKVAYSLLKMKETEAGDNKPIIIHSDLMVVNSGLNLLHKSFWEQMNLHPDIIGHRFIGICNYVTGCTMMFNNEAKRVSLLNKRYAVMHDSLISLSVVANQGVIYSIERPLLLYRQHGRNTLGAKESRFSITDKIKNIRQILAYNSMVFKMSKGVLKMTLGEYLIKKSILFFLVNRKRKQYQNTSQVKK